MSAPLPTSARLLEHFLRRDPEVEARVADCIARHRQGEARLRFVDADGGLVEPTRVTVRLVPGDGQWHRLTMDAMVPPGGARAYILVGVEAGGGRLAVDDVELLPVAP